MKKTIWILIAVIVISVFIHSINRKNEAETARPLKVGALLLLSGDFAPYGERSKNAIQIAVDEYNNNPQNKRKVEIIYEDTKGEPKQAISAYQKLTSLDHVDAIVGPLLQVEMAAIAPLVEKDNIPVFSVAPVPIERRTSGANPLVIWPDPTAEAEQMAEYVFKDGIRSVSILGTQDSWENEVSNAFAKKFELLGGKVVGTEIVQQSDKNPRVTVTKALAKKPEAIFLGTYYQFYPFVKAIKELGFKGKLYSIEIDTYLAEQAKGISDGLIFISPDFYTDEFAKIFEGRYGMKPSLPGGQAHDAMAILLSLYSKYETRDAVLKAMSELKQFAGVSGNITFNNHRAIFPLSIFELEAGLIIRK